MASETLHQRQKDSAREMSRQTETLNKQNPMPEENLLGLEWALFLPMCSCLQQLSFETTIVEFEPQFLLWLVQG